MSGPEGSSNKHCIVCAVGIFCPEHSMLRVISAPEDSGAFSLPVWGWKYVQWVSRFLLKIVL